MASSQRLPPSLLETLKYFDKYDYPLTADELWFWQHGTNYSKQKIKKIYAKTLSAARLKKEKISQAKWKIAFAAGERLGRIPNILAVFVTGSLAMNNATKNDDIDLMLVVAPNTLWITRLWVNLQFWPWRRKPGVLQAPDKICPNLWLDTPHLRLNPKNLYIAHEILQAKLLWEKIPIAQEILRQNSWVNKYLPVAYANLTSRKRIPLSLIQERAGVRFLNLLAFVLQYIYMLPKMTTEKIGLGYAFFHPR